MRGTLPTACWATRPSPTPQVPPAPWGAELSQLRVPLTGMPLLVGETKSCWGAPPRGEVTAMRAGLGPAWSESQRQFPQAQLQVHLPPAPHLASPVM